MADLTVLSSMEPMPLYPSLPNASRVSFKSFNAAASSSRVNLALPSPERERSRPKPLDFHARTKAREATLQAEPGLTNAGRAQALDDDWNRQLSNGPLTSSQSYGPSGPRSAEIPRSASPHIISPIPTTPRSRHRPTRSRSAPPERTVFREEVPPPSVATAGVGIIFERPRPKRGFTFNTVSPSSPWARGGELLRPPPPLHRPTTFWRRTRRSGVTASSYSPSTHLIRRSTFIAAGLAFDRPMYDGSALCVESRIRNDDRLGKAREVFWEVIV